MKMTIEFNQANFQSRVARPMQNDCTLLEEIATEHIGRVKIAKVNVDENPALC
jgi:thioredoxin-like negative regulator of GroEL